jgi:hypothetical protein
VCRPRLIAKRKAFFMKTIRYIPTIELFIFFAISVLTVSLYLIIGFHKGILILTIMLAYLFILGGTNFLKIKNGRISITYCYLVFWTDTVDLKDVVKIESQQTFQDESIDAEAVFYEFRRSYEIEFRDKKNRVKKLHFKIINNRKESEVVTEIKNALQQINRQFSR